MDDHTEPAQAHDSRADSVHSAAPSPSRASAFTAINVDNKGEPRRLRHVSRRTMQQQVDDGTVGEDNGPDRGFEALPHGTDFRDPPRPGKLPPPSRLD